MVTENKVEYKFSAGDYVKITYEGEVYNGVVIRRELDSYLVKLGYCCSSKRVYVTEDALVKD